MELRILGGEGGVTIYGCGVSLGVNGNVLKLIVVMVAWQWITLRTVKSYNSMACGLHLNTFWFMRRGQVLVPSPHANTFSLFLNQTASLPCLHTLLGTLSILEPGLSHMGGGGGLLAPLLSFPSCAFTHLFWSSHSSSGNDFPLQDLPAGGDFWTSVCGPHHREMRKALLLLEILL